MVDHFLASCESEQLHLSGAILAHGCLLVVDAGGLISHVSANIDAWLGGAPDDWIDQPLPEALALPVQNLAAVAGSRLVVTSVMPALPGRLMEAFDLVASRNAEGGVTLELLEHVAEALPSGPVFSLAQTLADQTAVSAAQHALVEKIAEITGFQRVMLYMFRDDGDGEVIAEARTGEVYGSYLGLRFPASDIPQIARTLYKQNPWRLIPDASTDPVALLARERTPPDLTYSDLRSVSPIHRVYLANMGVCASLSFPVVIGGGLNALVACHHNSPRQLSLGKLSQASQRVRNHAMSMTDFQTRQRMRMIDGLTHRFDNARQMLQRHGDVVSAWTELGAWLIQEFHADGASLCLDDECVSQGLGFEADVLAVFDPWFQTTLGEPVWSSDSLMRQSPEFPLSEVAGVLALRVKLVSGQSLRVYLCRRESIHEVAWGGNPEKPVEYHDGRLGIAPRHSFEKWMEKRLGYSLSWDNETRLLALKLRELLLREIRF
jgi:light-regulated signal transduction histidine kinase (bacteriophytochrome)